MLSGAAANYQPVAALDDDPLKQGTTLRGVPVAGPISSVREVARQTDSTAVVLALPAARSRELYRIADLCRRAELRIKTIPDHAQINRDTDFITRIRDLCVEDLLNHQPVRPIVPEIGNLLRGRVILVTGAAGGIGSELCRQIIEHDNAQALVCLDRDESGLMRLERRLRRLHSSVELEFLLADVKDRRRMESVFKSHWPNIVFHAAAYRSVPLLQRHPVEAVRNNVGGTRNVIDLSDRYRAGTFVLINASRAVEPTSVAEATQRITEQVVRARGLTSATRFCSVRVGDLLGLSGSASELILDGIRERRAVSITQAGNACHIMSIAEAVQLVLLATTICAGGEVFILDMGRPVQIDDLARTFAALSGLTPDVDVPIVYTGAQSGQELTAGLWTAQEKPRRTAHAGILVASGALRRGPDITEMVTRLMQSGEQNDLQGCRDLIAGAASSLRGPAQHGPAMPRDETARPGELGRDRAGGGGTDLGDGGDGRGRAA